MSWKSIEMQVALPRVQDAGKIQEQMQKQGQHYGDSLTQSQLKQEELKRKRVSESEDIQDLKLKKDTEDDSNNQSEEQSGDSIQTQEEKINHPYLGNRLDLNG